MLAEVRRSCAEIAASARHVRIDADAVVPGGGISGLDPELHFLDGSPEAVARYVLILDATNFGSGWFDELGVDTEVLTRRLTEATRARGEPWTAAELRALDSTEAGAAFGLDPAHELTRLYAGALNQLGGWLGSRTALEAVDEAAGSAERFAAALAAGMPFYEDPGFYKRAQITANDLVLAGVARFEDVDALTVFADNLLPHVLRLESVLRYDGELTAAVDAGRELEHGGRMEREIRACAVVACERIAARLGVPERTLDNWLWNRGTTLPGGAHRTRTTAY